MDIIFVLLFNMQMKALFSRMRKVPAPGIIFGQTVTLALFFCLFFLPYSAAALGFGTPVIESHLNEPLKGYIPLMLAGTESIEQIKVELATPKEYQHLGLQWHDSMASIRVLLPRGNSGAARVELSSVGVVRFPMLSVVLKARKTGRGTYFRHFRILLDPAYIALPTGKQPQVLPVQPTTETRSQPEENDDAGWARVWRYGPVRSGDSLSEIAYRLRKDKRWSNRQVMLSLYEENPDGFIDQDIHRLKRGAWLSVPSAAIVEKNGSKSALLKLDGLLRNKSKAAEPGSQADAVAATEERSRALRYSGMISVKDGVGAKRPEQENITPASNESMENLQTIHAEVMSSKLQMDNLGRTVEGLGKSMAELKMDMKALRQEVATIPEVPAELKQEIQSLKQEVTGIKEALPEFLQAMSMQATPVNSPTAAVNMLKNYWAVAFFVLLIVCLGFLTGSSYQRRANRLRKEPAADVKQPSQPESPAVQAPQQKISADETDQYIDRIEESLGKGEYEQAEQLLRVLEKLAPDLLKASVLWAQLYHETARTEQRDMLISTICEDSDEPRWERFCHLLPTPVWNACFDVASADQVNVDAGNINDPDSNTVAMNDGKSGDSDSDTFYLSDDGTCDPDSARVAHVDPADVECEEIGDVSGSIFRIDDKPGGSGSDSIDQSSDDLRDPEDVTISDGLDNGVNDEAPAEQSLPDHAAGRQK